MEKDEVEDFAFSAESDDGGSTLSEVELYAKDLEPGEGKEVTNIPSRCAIIKAKAFRTNEDLKNTTLKPPQYRGFAPLWIKAHCTRRHIVSPFENTRQRNETANKLLAMTIRSRGKPDDVAGHMLALQLSGVYADYNLFPQNKALNGGFQGMFQMWRGVEAAIALYLKVEPRNPRVKLQVRLFYDANDSMYPYRPYNMAFSVKFLRDDDDHENEDGEIVIQTMRVLINAAIAPGQTVKHKALYKVANDLSVGECKPIKENLSYCREIIRIWLEIIEPEPEPVPTYEPKPEPVPEPVQPSSSWSVWDFVPVVSTVRTLRDAKTSFDNGSNVEGFVNLGFGVLSAVSDATMVGGLLTSAVKGATTTAVKGVVKQGVATGVKEVAKQGGKASIKKIVKEESKVLAQNLAKTMAKREATRIGINSAKIAFGEATGPISSKTVLFGRVK